MESLIGSQGQVTLDSPGKVDTAELGASTADGTVRPRPLVPDADLRARLAFRLSCDRGFRMTNTQTVTVLFTDIVGSTELSSRLGPDQADRARQSHFRAWADELHVLKPEWR